MWHLTPAILYLACAQERHYRHPNSPSAFIINNDRMKVATYSYNPVLPPPAPAPYICGPPRPCLVYPSVPLLPCYNYPAQKLPMCIQDNFYNAPSCNKQVTVTQGSMYYNKKSNDLYQRQSQMKLNPLKAEFFPDHSSDLGMDVDSKTSLDEQSYYEELKLVEAFGNFLKKKTQLHRSSTALDATHQYNALLAVIIALARVVKDSCADFDQIYDEVYMPIVNAYYKIGLTNPDKVADMINDFISKGRAHMSKIIKIKEELCEKEKFCSLSVDNAIEASPLLYVRELETLEALSYLAQNYLTYVTEFNQVATRGTVLPYLQNSKERLKEFVMQFVNSIEHVSDKPVTCK